MDVFSSTLQKMSTTTQNNTTELIEVGNVELAKKTSAPAKNRASYITEAFEAIVKVEGFPLTTEQLWDYFEKAAMNKDIKLRKLSEKNSKKTAEKEPKRLSGHNLFIKEFKGDIPKGASHMTEKNVIWKALSDEDKTKFRERANEINKSNGYEPKATKIKSPSLKNYINILERWYEANPETRGEKPERPKKAESSPEGSEISD